MRAVPGVRSAQDHERAVRSRVLFLNSSGFCEGVFEDASAHVSGLWGGAAQARWDLRGGHGCAYHSRSQQHVASPCVLQPPTRGAVIIIVIIGTSTARLELRSGRSA